MQVCLISSGTMLFMTYLFLDESGDLGFKHGSTRYFMISLVLTDDRRGLEKIVKRIFRGFSKTEKKSHGGVLHAYSETPRTRKKLLTLFHAHAQSRVFVICVNKEKVSADLQNEKHTLYNFAVSVLLQRLYTKNILSTDKRVCLVASRRETNKLLNENFITYLKKQIKKYDANMQITIRKQNEEKALQVTDIVSWAVFRKYEYGDDTYYSLLQDDIVEESMLY